MKFEIFLLLILLFAGGVFAKEFTDVEESALFDIVVEIPEDFHQITSEEELFATIKLVNLGGAGRIDVFLNYRIENKNGEVILGKEETIAIETQANLVREFDLTGNPSGEYVLYAKMIYADGKEASSQHSFRIERGRLNDMELIGLIIGFILILVFLWFLIKRLRPIISQIKIRSKVREIVKNSKKEVLFLI